MVENLEPSLLDGPAVGGMGLDAVPSTAVTTAPSGFGLGRGSRARSCRMAAGSAACTGLGEIASTAVVPVVRPIEITISICIVAMGAVYQYVIPAQDGIDHIEETGLVGIAHVIVGDFDIIEIVHATTNRALAARPRRLPLAVLPYNLVEGRC